MPPRRPAAPQPVPAKPAPAKPTPLGPPQPPPQAESVVYGINAALALAKHRPEAILRVFHSPAVRLQVAPLLKAAAAHRRPYRELGTDELEKVAHTQHHEGVVVVASPVPLQSAEALFARLRPDGLYVAVDDVGNPHNLGAILRSAAYFGVAGLILPLTDRQASLSAAAVRIAQGGAEVVPAYGVPDLAATLRQMAARGVAPVAGDTRGGVNLRGFVWPRGVCLVMGNEGEGLATPVRAACGLRISIEGAGLVESLNVSVAAGVLLASAAARGQQDAPPK